ncbi:hypothetical protein C8R42DRAFT_691043 [Lentinula raphanica]|nr:hypothetical protein C8R42DRAFT_691043 [Lentinula raphanica]
MDVLGNTKDAIELLTLLYRKYSDYQDADETIKSICTRLDGVQVRLELFEEYLQRAESNLRSRHKQILVKSLEKVTDILHDLSERLPDPITVSRKIAWVAWGKRRVEGLLADLDTWDNDSQRTIFTYDMLNRIRGHDILYERLFITGDRSLAATWSLSRRIHSSDSETRIPDLAIPLSTIRFDPHGFSNRYLAKLNSELVYMEALTHQRHVNDDEKKQAIERTKKIAEVFHSSDLPSMHLLSCLGIAERCSTRPPRQSIAEHHLVYQIPRPDVEIGDRDWYSSVPTLTTAFNDEVCMSLEDHFRIATEITMAVMEIHAAGWVHKNIRSDNVLLFYDKNKKAAIGGTAQIGTAYLVGFGGARPQTYGSARLAEVDWVKRRYHHPERKRTTVERFDIRHDMYSLGVVLIELGHRRQLFEISISNEDEMEVEEDHRKLVKFAHDLGKIMGTKYASAALTCLTKSTEKKKTTDMLREEFYDDVLLPLKQTFEGLKFKRA